MAYDWTISPTVLNHLAAGYNRFGNKNQSVFVDQGGPHYTGEDIGIEKTWKIDEAKSFELRGVFLNPFNRHGRGNPVTDLSSPFFGQITGPQVGPRNIELSARITF